MADVQSFAFGKCRINDFSFRQGLRHLNQGSYGTSPDIVRDAMHRYQAEIEELPDQFLQLEYAEKLMIVRRKVAELVYADANEIAFVTNATTGVNVILRSFDFGVRSGIWIICEAKSSHEIKVHYPTSDQRILADFQYALETVPDIRMAVFDHIASLPGVKLPWIELIKLCRRYQVLSIVDGAHGIGHVQLDLHTADPDFFVSNCHKWLHSPRPTAILYVPERNQHLIYSMPIVYGYISGKYRRANGSSILPAGMGKTPFIFEFEAHSTIDYSPFLATKDAIEYRESIGGEAKIIKYCTDLSQIGGRVVADILQTEVMPGEPICMTNIRLPIDGREDATIMPPAQRIKWFISTCMGEFNLVVDPYILNGNWWVRLSAQIFNDVEDFKFAGRTLAGLCEKINAEHTNSASE